ncbi:MAG: Crp/Fnr family transcriptional regulator [Leptolyngbya sp. SIO4C1]|nr:Crp/Fnr family transcriptional regulator [Leptolyngbya sp. SIO4C1]
MQEQNRLLAELSQHDYTELLDCLTPVDLPLGHIIFEPGERIEKIYFPIQTMVSLVSVMRDGATTEISLVGKEGLIGLPAILGGLYSTNQAIVQIYSPSGIYETDVEVVRQAFLRPGPFQDVIFRYIQARLMHVSQIAACNRRHMVEERLARWLLSAQDSIGSDDLPLTQEFIANMLGIRRSGVTVAAGALQKAGMIRYSRGKIKILDRAALKETTCECYQLIRSEFKRLLEIDRG